MSDDEDATKQAEHHEADELQDKFEADIAATNALSSQKKRKSASGKPTRPLSAYNLYYRDQRAVWLEALQTDPEIKKIPPKERFLAMGRHISKLWNELSEPEKQKYKEEAAPYYAEFLEEKKRFKVKKSKEAVAERKLLEEAAQREKHSKEERHGTEAAASSQYDLYSQRLATMVSSSSNPSFRDVGRDEIGSYASMVANPQQQSAEALTAMLGHHSRGSEAFLNTPSHASFNFSHFNSEHQQPAQYPNSLTAILETIQREQQQVLMNRLLADLQHVQQQQQLGYAAAASTEDQQNAQALTRNIEGNSGRDAAVAAFLELFKRGNPPGF